MPLSDIGFLVETARLAQYAENEAKELAGRGEGAARPAKARAVLTRALRETDKTAAALSGGHFAETRPYPQEFEWLLDNRYMIEREGKDALNALRGLPPLPSEAYGVMPTVYKLAFALVRSGRGMVNAERLSVFLSGVQKVRALNENELWLFIPFLKAALIVWIEEVCREINAFLRALARKESPSQPEALHSRLSLCIGNAVGSLRYLAATDLSGELRESSLIEQILSQDPSGVYPAMSESSRAYYRATISKLARKHGISEQSAAQKALELSRSTASPQMRHVGYYILRKPLGFDKPALAGKLYFAAFIALWLLFAAAVALTTGSPLLTAVLLLPLSEASKNLCDALTVRITRPGHIPRLELPHGIPPEGRTLCIIACLLSGEGRAAAYASLLERYKQSNRDSGLYFGLLCDLPDSRVKNKEGDEAVLREAQNAVSELNRRYGGGFYLFTRQRRYSTREKKFMAWERKRGAILELVRLLRGKESGMSVVCGDSALLPQVKYCITLDSDTRLTAGSARELAGAMLHPLCRPVIDEKRRVVVSGYGILQPRVSVELSSAIKTGFTRLIAGHGGLDAYSGAASDVYQDVFGEGSFTGKGIFDVDVFLGCLDGRFPTGRILSHDLLEGAYLRCGMIGDVEWSDAHPERPEVYFARAHRWARGDWQIAAWLFGRVPGGGANPVSALNRWKIADNLRRSLVPVTLLGAIAYSALVPGTGAGMLAALLCLCSGLLIQTAELIGRARRHNAGTRYSSTIISGWPAALGQTAYALITLPALAKTNASAILVSLWRILVSKKRLLEWLPSQDASGRAPKDAAGFLRAYFFSVALAILMAAAAQSPVAYLLSALWLISPVVCAAMGMPASGGAGKLREADRAFLLRQAALMWSFFSELCTEKDNFLPPDNWQEQPAVGIAHRTSPTNIGLAMLCAFAACELGLAPRDDALRLIERMLSTVEKLPKWKGHIYNWYDTRTLKPLAPRCVSTVDSGNLAGCLIALSHGLNELNDSAAEDLAARCYALYESMSFEPLYDKKKRLLHIGYDLDKDAPAGGYYDLLASEARQTSYIAIARGELPKNHWRRLGRALVAHEGYAGMASWTGTMFEYLMPLLLMPCHRDSLIYESAVFALRCQRARGRSYNIPWGISESCFYAFDSALNYQYKAHGVPRLAYKRGMGRELVVSPYSSYLALLIAPKAAVSNLRRFRELGLEGRYGFAEAADFTPSRVSEGKRFEPVRCYMSHHLGMSLLAVSHVLTGGAMQKRFMREPAMGAFDELLQERVPVGALTVRTLGREAPERPQRVPGEGIRREFTEIEPLKPRCHLLSNASYSLMLTDSGINLSSCKGIELTRFDGQAAGSVGGMRFAIYCGGGLHDLTPYPSFDGDAAFSALMGGAWAEYSMAHGLISAVQTVRVPDNENAETRLISIRNSGRAPLHCELVCYFEPVLASRAAYESHPAFSKLFIETDISEKYIHMRRRPRGEDESGIHAVFACDNPAAVFDSSRALALGRGGAGSLLNALRKPAAATQGAVLDPCVLVRVPLTIAAGGEEKVKFALSMAETRSDAVEAALRCLSESFFSQREGRLDGLLRLYELSQADMNGAFGYLAAMIFGGSAHKDARSRNRQGQSALWRFGISGDLPILLAFIDDDSKRERVGSLIRMARLLSDMGRSCDLVLVTDDGGDYRRPTGSLIHNTLRALGRDELYGARGGVFALDLAVLSEPDLDLLRASASVIAAHEEPKPEQSALPVPALPPPRELEPADMPEYRWDSDGSFSFDTGAALPKLAWCHTLASPSFGALVTETGAGFMWRYNSRENKILPWTNDPLAVKGAESVRLRVDGRELSVFSDDDGLYCRVSYGFGTARWEKRFRDIRVTTTAFVPPKRMARVLIIEVRGAADAQIRYSAELTLGSGRDDARHVYTVLENGRVRAVNHYNSAYEPQSFLFMSEPAASELAAEQRIDAVIPASGGKIVIVTGCAANLPSEGLLSELLKNPESALRETKDYWDTLVRPHRYSGSGRLERYMNGWALYQIIACRMYARCSVYQCGGAYGFRDQLQDACALAAVAPELLRRQILRSAAHQFEEGDVMHWWHPAGAVTGLSDKGVRTRITDDLLWLPYSVCEYIDAGNDEALLKTRVPYVSAPPLTPDEHDRFQRPGLSACKETIYEHCLRALDLVTARGKGSRGLLLIGGGDWNDGFDRVGIAGRGESVWLTWFAAHVYTRFAGLCERSGDSGRASAYRQESEALIAAAENAWDGSWYLRGSYDDGSVLGGAESSECQIDSIAQSFAYWVGVSDPERRERALDAALEQLCSGGVIKLFTPPFSDGAAHPGYIKGYVPGVRENGGQYTHAAVWLAYACLLAGRRGKCRELLLDILPGDTRKYLAEPYVLAADVYSNPQHFGRGGWSWYTGAAGWFYRVCSMLLEAEAEQGAKEETEARL